MSKTKSTRTRTRRAIAHARLSMSKMFADAKQPAAIIGGMIVGKIASDLLDKGFNAASTTVSGLNGTVKTVAKPIILCAAGLVGMQMLKNPIAKNVAMGIATFGAANAVTEGLNIPVFANITGGSAPIAIPPIATTAGFGNAGNAPWGYANEIRPARRLTSGSLPRLSLL